MKKYNFEFTDLEGPEDMGQFLSADLIACGNDLDELLDDATYFLIDQDGGEFCNDPADDQRAVELITERFRSLQDAAAEQIEQEAK